jgi:hypothetical protein
LLEFVNSRCPLSSGLDQLSIVFLEVTSSGRMLRRNGLNLLPMVFLDFIDPGIVAALVSSRLCQPELG